MAPKIRFARQLLLALVTFWIAGCQTQGLQTTPTTAVPPSPLASPTLQPATTVTLTAAETTATPFSPDDTATPVPTGTPTPEPLSVRFAVIGDYGGGGRPERDVADLVNSWKPDFVITTGDNNYPDGEWTTIDANIGQFYHQYIYPYTGDYGAGADRNRFFPTLGNHDWNTDSARPYLEYFTLPGNERYYDFTWEPVHLFALDSDSREPDGVGRSSSQAAWLQEKLAASPSPWKIVYMHHPPYSSGLHGPVDWTRWPYADWGASAVISGHDHTYERILVNGVPHFVNGLGGGAIYRFVNITEGSQLRYNDDYGAMLVEATEAEMTFQFINRQGEVIDIFSLQKGE